MEHSPFLASSYDILMIKLFFSNFVTCYFVAFIYDKIDVTKRKIKLQQEGAFEGKSN